MSVNSSRGDKLQIMLSREELGAVDTWRFQRHMPSRAAAVRELLKRGLSAEGFNIATTGLGSSSFGVLADNDSQAAAPARSRSQNKSR